MAVTMRDVARKAGVSTRTVSRVINNQGEISQATRQHVLAVVEALGYQPNAVARSLRSKKTRTIGMVIPDSSSLFFAEVARSIEDTCFAEGYSVILCNSDGNKIKERTYIDVLIEKQVDGLIFVSAGHEADHLGVLSARGIPVIIVDRDIQDPMYPCVLSDNRSGGRQATAYLIAKGHRRIACITGPSDVTPSADRVRGYQDALVGAGLPLDEELICRGDFEIGSGFAAMERLLSLSAPPTAVFACNDMMALGAIACATRRGLRVPHDVAVVGYDDIILASYANPPLTTVSQRPHDMGRVAAQLLVNFLTNKCEMPMRTILDVKLIVRESA